MLVRIAVTNARTYVELCPNYTMTIAVYNCAKVCCAFRALYTGTVNAKESVTTDAGVADRLSILSADALIRILV